ncbi:class I lanthipeptide [Spirosoma koreense]
MKKKINLGNKLALDKETISKLDENQLKALAGGGSLSCNGGAVAAEGEPDGQEELATIDVNSCCNNSCNTKA